MVDNDKTLSGRRSGNRRRQLKHGVTKTPRLLSAAAYLISLYLRLVRSTSSFVVEPDNYAELADSHLPIIAVSWHGQFILMPAIDIADVKFDALVSRHTDGEVIAQIIKRFGHRARRGSGTNNPSRMHEKGGVAAFRELASSLSEGRSVFISADHTRLAPRHVSRGIVNLARLSGRPIVPLALATSRFVVLSTWDKTTINLPFSKGALVIGTPIWVPKELDDTAAAALRDSIAREIDKAADRALEIARGN